ncbi:hypothetical protein F5Y15DRAFT_411608 [Xylariaceae sp. FL0016]|nr:hypothetical protein F5Y15DRAFT_411608 [Xylariaceae sp. FL0016]
MQTQPPDLDSSVPDREPSIGPQSQNVPEHGSFHPSTAAADGHETVASAAAPTSDKQPTSTRTIVPPAPAGEEAPATAAAASATASHGAAPLSTLAAGADLADHPSQATTTAIISPSAAGAGAGAGVVAREHEHPAVGQSDPQRKSPKMIFSDLYKSTKSPFARFRPQSHTPVVVAPDFDPDLVSRDKARQKEAVKRFLAERIRNDWEFKWPPSPQPATQIQTQTPDSADSAIPDQVENAPGRISSVPSSDVGKSVAGLDGKDEVEADSEDDAVSIYSTVSEDPSHFCARMEWSSDASDNEDDSQAIPSAYRFEDPEAVGNRVKIAELERSARRRRAVRAEMEWNSGLACFNARRDAWTNAKVARVRPKPASPVVTSPTSRRLSFFRLPTSPTSPTETSSITPLAPRTSGDTTAVASSDNESKDAKTKQDSSSYQVQTLLPIPPPLLPPANPMRASITPASHPSIYDKIVVQSLTPACPVNLGDVTRSCVAGWKRDGEWPPRPTQAPPVVAVRKKKSQSVGEGSRPNTGRRLSFSFLGRKQSTPGDSNATANHPSTPTAKEEETGNASKGVRRSLQRVLGLGHERTGSTGSHVGGNAGPA